MNVYAVSALINLLTGASLCLAIMSKDRRSKLDLQFAFFSLAACVWSVGYFFWQISHDYASALMWSKVLMAGAILIGSSYFHFVLEFLDITKKNKWLLYGADLVYIALFALNFSGNLVVRMEPRLFFIYWPVPGWAFHVFLVFWVLTVSYSSYLLYKRYQVARGLLRQQITYLFWGLFVGFIAGSFNYLLWYGIPIPPVTNVLVSVYFFSVFYSIIKYRFFNIKIITTEIFVLVLVAITVWQFYVSENTNPFLAAGFIMMVVIASGFLIKSVLNEVRQREELERLSGELQGANEQLQTLDKARAEFISIASHQLRTPPATIKWYLAAILDGDYGKLQPKTKTALSKAQVTNNNLIGLIDDMLNASRIERGKMEFLFEESDILKIVDSVVMQFVPHADMKKLKLVWKKPKSRFPLILLDKEKFSQVINNLIDNAIKYSKAGEIRVSLSKTDTDFMIKIKDSGKGIAQADLPNVFEKYGRGKNSQKSASGLGLGLYVAKIVVEHHKGRIWAESPGEGQGSTFVVSLPIHTDLVAETFDLAKSGN